MQGLVREDIAHPELSYKIVGVAFTVSNELGYGHLEKVYQRAFAKELKLQGINFKEQAPYSVSYKGEVVGKNYLDFLIEETVIVELKRNDISR
jgi:GxxExxY protein